jgi:hypothetical protein
MLLVAVFSTLNVLPMWSATRGAPLTALFLTIYVFSQAQSIQSAKQNGLLPDSAQQTISSSAVSSATLACVKRKYARIEKFMQDRTTKMLNRMENAERSLQKKLESSDSAKAQQLFTGSAEKYEQLKMQMQKPSSNSGSVPLKQYVSGLDSIQTGIRFLKQDANISGLSLEKLQQITAVDQQISLTAGRLQQAEQVQQFIKSREQQIKDQLSNMGWENNCWE